MSQHRRISLEAGLDAVIYDHSVQARGRSLHAVTLVSDGLSQYGQREVLFTALREGPVHDGFPDGVLQYVPVLKRFAVQGRFVDHGGVSGYRPPGPFGMGPFVGLAFQDAPAITGIVQPRNALLGVFLTEGELAMASRCSVTRVLNQLGKQARYFPAPYWCDPPRSSVYAVEDVERSILRKFERASVAGATATLRGDAMQLTVPSSFARSIANRIEARQVTAVLPRRDEGVHAALVWTPGQQDAEAIFVDGADASAVAATFVAFIPNDASEDEIRFMEDGYVALLSRQSAERLIDALRTTSPIHLKCASGRSLQIVTSQLS